MSVSALEAAGRALLSASGAVTFLLRRRWSTIAWRCGSTDDYGGSIAINLGEARFRWHTAARRAGQFWDFIARSASVPLLSASALLTASCILLRRRRVTGSNWSSEDGASRKRAPKTLPARRTI